MLFHASISFPSTRNDLAVAALHPSREWPPKISVACLARANAEAAEVKEPKFQLTKKVSGTQGSFDAVWGSSMGRLQVEFGVLGLSL